MRRYYVGEAARTDEFHRCRREVAKFIEKYGEGFYLLSLKVDNAEEALRELKEKNIPHIDAIPRRWRDSNYIFLKPQAMFGVLTELID